MGGLRKWMPITAATFIIGWLTIAGIFPFAGFWSKDEILAAAWATDNYALWFVGAVAALFTAFYMTRQVWLVFYGNARWDDSAAHGDDVHAPDPSELVEADEPVAAGASGSVGSRDGNGSRRPR